MTVSVVVLVVSPYCAEITADVGVETALVCTTKVAVVCPAATATVAGTFATPGLALDKLIVTPPLGAPALRVTVPVAGSGPGIEDGETLTEY